MRRISIPADVILRGNQHQARTGSDRLRPVSTSECQQNAGDGEISSEYAQPNGGYHGDEQDERHQERNHDQFNLV
jgi:hypothetical protein